MFIFAHLGIGRQLVKPLTKGLPLWMVLFGTLLPDLIDKPLYYSLCWITGKHASELGLISGTRTFGHTALFLGLIALVAALTRSRAFAALALGVGSHFVLDSWSDLFLNSTYGITHSALLWPFFGWQFPVDPFSNLKAHLEVIGTPVIIYGEILGLLLLAWNFFKGRLIRSAPTRQSRAK